MVAIVVSFFPVSQAAPIAASMAGDKPGAVVRGRHAVEGGQGATFLFCARN